MTKPELDRRILELEGELKAPKRYPTEIYTRIVGYYRSLANWNDGKREEYKHRTEYAEDGSSVARALSQPAVQPTQTAAPATSYLLFTQPTCPRCPAMKAKSASISLPGMEIDAGDQAGFPLASQWGITSTPTLILLDDQGSELARIMNAGDWPLLWPHL